jgi:hypothetical protein
MARAGRLKEYSQLQKEADAQRKEDEERIKLLREGPGFDKDLHDRAGACVQDQAQTALEAVLHLADQEEPIIDLRRQRAVETLEDNTVDLGLAQEVTLETVRAQAVNQPVPLANEEGKETEFEPVTGPGAEGFAVNNDAVVLPPDELTPKTVAQAEEAAEGLVPDVERMIGDGKVSNDLDPASVESIDIFEAAPDISMNWGIPGDEDKRLEDGAPVAKRRGRPPKNRS